MKTEMSFEEFKNCGWAEFLVIVNILGNTQMRFCNNQEEVKNFLYAARLLDKETGKVYKNSENMVHIFALKNLALDYALADEKTQAAMENGW